jgi:hypothetical protein
MTLTSMANLRHGGRRWAESEWRFASGLDGARDLSLRALFNATVQAFGGGVRREA